MKITFSDATTLQAKDNATGGLIAAIVFIGLGIALLVTGLATATLPWWIGLVVTLLGALTLFTWKTVTLSLSRQTGSGSIAIKSIIKNSLVNFDLSAVQKVQLTSQYRTDRGSNGEQTQQLVTQLLLFLANGQVIELANGSSSMSMGIMGIGQVPNKEVGQSIATFLQVPFEENGAMGIQQAVSTVLETVRSVQQQAATAPSIVPVQPVPLPQAPQPQETSLPAQNPPNNQ